MLTDQETPEMSDEPRKEQIPPQVPTPPEETVSETSQEEPAIEESVPTDTQSEPPLAQEGSEQQKEADPTPEPEESPAVAEVSASLESPPSAEPDTPEQPGNEGKKVEESAPPTEEEPPKKSGKPAQMAIPTPEDLPPLNESVELRVADILSQKGSSAQVLSQAAISDLVHLLDKYLTAENILAQAPKVSLVKRSYDTLKYQEDVPKELEELFLSRLATYNQRRISEQKKLEDVRAVNLTKKQALLETLKTVVDAEDPLRIEEVRSVQDEWKSIGQVPKANLDELYSQYRAMLDKFYQLREMHFELLEYDRKINLQEKERLIVEAKTNLIPAEEVREDPDVWRDKMDLLNELQQQWKSVGHVPREDMDRVNNDYRAIIDEFFEIRQGFRDKMDELRQVNADQKVAILEKMEEFRAFDADRPRAWNDANRTFREYQEAYKAIGQAPQSINGELWAKYRDICNAFYGKKAEFFKKFDEMRQENLEKKKVLVERVEELAKGGDWERTAKELKRLQREWKQIGPVPDRHSNKLWARFREACDAFFEARRSHYHDLHAEEHENLEQKKALIAEVKKLTEAASGDVPEMIEQVKGIQRKWREIGKVPYKEKDKIWDEFRGEVDAFFNSLPAKRSEVREMRAKTSIESIDDLDERSKAIKDRIQRLRRKVNKANETINQYLDNMDRIARGKSGDPLRKQIQNEIDKEKALITDWKKQVKEFNQMLKNPPPPKPEPAPETPEQSTAEEAAPAETTNEPATETPTEVVVEAPANASVEEAASSDAPVALAAETPEETAASAATEAAPSVPLMEESAEEKTSESSPSAEQSTSSETSTEPENPSEPQAEEEKKES